MLLSLRHLLTVALAAVEVQSRPSARADPSWHKYVRSPSTNNVNAKSIISERTAGSVTNPSGIIDGKQPTVLTRDNPEDTAPSIVIDFGQNLVGTLSIKFAGSTKKGDGLPGLRLAYSETLEFLKDRSDFTRSDNAGGEERIVEGTDQIAVKTDPYTWESHWGCEHDRKVCSDGLHGFRYVRIWLDAIQSDAPHTSATGSVSISSVSLDLSMYLGTPDTFTGWFECSNPDITQWWFDGVYTVDIGTDVFLKNETEPRGAYSPSLDGKQVLFDGAKRDRDPYVGDLAVASLTSYLSHDFAESSRNVLADLAEHQRSDGWIPPASINGYALPLFDYPLWWVVCSVDLVMYTGDVAYANKYWNVLKKTLDEYYPKYRDADTKLVVKSAELGYGDYAFLPRSGPITYYNALYVHALKYAATLANSLDHKDDAKQWNDRAAEVGKALLEKNFDKKVNAFYDGGPCPGQAAGTYCDVHAQDGNSIAILAGVTDNTVSKQILDYWAKKTSKPYGNTFYDSSVLSPENRFDERVYAFISYFELAARLATPGAADSAFDEIKRLYGWMASHDPKITQWEGIGPGGSLYQGGFTSMAHGWSTGIVPLMSNYVLGVKPVTPGFKKWSFCPVVDFGDLTWASGVVPTPSGGLEASWKVENKVLSLVVKPPGGTSGVVCIPLKGKNYDSVTVNGNKVGKSAFVEPEGVVVPEGSAAINVDGGETTITVDA